MAHDRQSAPGLGLATGAWSSPSPTSSPDARRNRSSRRPERAARRGGVAGSSRPRRRHPRRAHRASTSSAFTTLTGTPFPQDPTEQLEAAVRAVLDSWQAPKAREYRRLNGLPEYARHRGDPAADGVRQRRRLSGSGVGLHAQSRHRGAAASTWTSCSTRRARTSSPAARPWTAPRSWRSSHPRLRGAHRRRLPDPGGRVRRRAGVRADRPGRRAVPAPDAHRQAHALGGAADRRRPGREGLIDQAAGLERIAAPRP